ncbi:MAG: undecaprenyl/decaprenyl-phosphate alpha-N-acetylglucosaminyl 1-phosphate transferase [Flavobacteriales bacterium]|nr:undecaprenyl/decaprenyl-phosphate alpha-N-acetylglucosaminyl 1-phosphate transferase [Flavobacteriales bacterium]
MGIRNIDDKVIRWNTTSKPAFGGISFFIVFLLVLTQYQIFFPNQYILFDLKIIGIVVASSLGFLVGLADDAFNTNPMLKSIAQALCAIVLIATGNHIEIFETAWLNYVFTFIWVVGLMNSINMLDNMDGITTIASIFALLAMLVVIVFSNSFDTSYFIIVLGLIGALLGFLFFNWNPSKMYMGDTGSQFLGVVLAALSIKFLWNHIPNEHEIVSRQFILPILAFIVPLSDTATVVINRILKGKSPFVGGKDHTTHHLSYLGLSDQSVALIMSGIGIFSTVTLLIAVSIKNWTHLFTILFALYALVVFVSLFLTTKPKLWGKEKLDNNEEQTFSKSA